MVYRDSKPQKIKRYYFYVIKTRSLELFHELICCFIRLVPILQKCVELTGVRL